MPRSCNTCCRAAAEAVPEKYRRHGTEDRECVLIDPETEDSFHVPARREKVPSHRESRERLANGQCGPRAAFDELCVHA